MDGHTHDSTLEELKQHPGWVFVIQRSVGGRPDGEWVCTKGEEAAWSLLRLLEEQEKQILRSRNGKNPWGEVVDHQAPWLNGFRMWAVLTNELCHTYDRVGRAMWGSPSTLLYGWSNTHLFAQRTLLESLQEQWQANRTKLVMPEAR